MYHILRIDDSSIGSQRDLNEIVANGYKFVCVIPGNPGVFDTDNLNVVGSTSTFLLLEKPDDPVDAILTAIDGLDDDQIVALINALPDEVIDPICQRCDPAIDDAQMDDDERQIVNRLEFPFVRAGERPAFEIIPPAADENTQ